MPVSNYLMDTYALMEYLDGSIRGQKVRDILESKSNKCYLLSDNAAELVSIYLRRKWDLAPALQLIRGLPPLLLDMDSAEDAGRIHAKMREKNKHIGLIDAILIAMARRHGLKIVTGDQHFKGVPEAILI